MSSETSQPSQLRLARISVHRLTHDPDNARARGPRAVEAIARSLDAFGQQKPIVVTEGGVVIAGNGTLDAAKMLGWEALECQVADLSPAQARAFAVADNRTAELAYWNDAQLLRALDAAQEAEMLEATGFDEADLEGIRRALEGDGEDPEGTVQASGKGESELSGSTAQCFATTVVCHTEEGAEAVRQFVKDGDLGRASAIRPRAL